MQLSLFEWIGIRLAAELMDDSKVSPDLCDPFPGFVCTLATHGGPVRTISSRLKGYKRQGSRT